MREFKVEPAKLNMSPPRLKKTKFKGKYFNKRRREIRKQSPSLW